ncbi:histidine ammonia-lyase [Halarsenatibacter silvermanii]|uniref:Histidine ammonia-lyase n=1 Tax=Halarsenatibacter silvermanii TaxID=321763 RepID=A0A1G9RHQ0_9FIRM|nr:histidine ammonia-lyase [Halarsenatibacter silvermanii]SDM22590.1 histidine ammonia-lyase [Halarsenatibacter silvermanii]
MIKIDGQKLSVEEVVQVARENKKVTLAEAAIEDVKKARRQVEKVVEENRICYGLNTGFGRFSDTRISPQEVLQLQENLIRSHAVGTGKPLSREVVRATMVLRINALAKGHSGIRHKTLKLLVDMLNKGVHPVMPAQGSLGASGDLAPLAHMALVLMGEGRAKVDGKEMTGKKALARCGLSPVKLDSKEGLALINGTQMMTAFAALSLVDALNLLQHADIALGLTMEGVEGILAPFKNVVHEVRPHPGQSLVAANLYNLLKESSLVLEKQDDRVQDAYSLRCAPQVHGASRDAYNHVKKTISREVNSATDNPLLFPDRDEIISGGNFHGQPLALTLDYLAMALSEIGNISERRVFRMLDGTLNNDLPMFLTEHGGLNSGYMVAQYTSASLVGENKMLTSPASTDSIPTSANQEDHVSMGAVSARKLKRIVENLSNIIAIEFVTAAQAVEMRTEDPKKELAPATFLVFQRIRKIVPKMEKDRVLAEDIASMKKLIAEEEILNIVKNKMDFA